MVSVIIRRDSNNAVKGFEVSGHAGYAKRAGEKDVVCAAVSAIVYTALGYMEEFFNMEDFEERDGYIGWEMPLNISEESRACIMPVLEAMVVGLKQVEDSNRKYVKILEEV